VRVKTLRIYMPDEIDHKIVEFLNRDFRMPYAEIAKALGVSRQTVKNRVDALRKRGVLYWEVRLRPAISKSALVEVEDSKS